MTRYNLQQLTLPRLVGKISSKVGVYFVISLLSRVTSAVGMFLWMRRSEVPDFGEFSYYSATAGLLGGVFSLGLEMSMNVLLSQARAENQGILDRLVAGAAIALGGVIFTLIAAAALFLSGWTKSYEVVGMIAALAVVQIVGAYVNGICWGYNRSKTVACVWLTSATLFAFASHARGVMSAREIFYCYALSVFLPVLLQSVVITNMLWRTVRSECVYTKVVLSEAIALCKFGIKNVSISGLMLMTLWLVQSSIASRSDGKVQLAVYALSTQVYNIVIFLPSIVGPLILSKMSSMNETGKSIFVRKTIVAFIWLSILICAGAYLGTVFITQFLPAKYHIAPVVALIASFAASLQFIKSPVSIYFQSTFTMRFEAFSTLLGAFCIGLIIVLIGPLTADGGASSRLVAHAVQLGCMAVLFVRYTRFKD